MTPSMVCFAVKEEARPFERLHGRPPHVRTLLTGMGPRNAEKAIRNAIAGEPPGLILTCGFAGGLRPGLASGTVVFASTGNADLESALARSGAQPGRFHCVTRVATTAEEKRALRKSTGADAVEMESQVICAVCRETNIPCATVRVILDTAEENLPLDFNFLMTPDHQLRYVRLATMLLAAPGKIPALLRLQKQSRAAAEKLALVLARALEIS
jgi:nucleoside phosphorylase